MTNSAQTALAGAEWITSPDAVPPAGERPGYEFRSTFEVHSVPPAATLAATAHGIYEAFINGARVGDIELAPGSTSYRKTLYVQTYDVTHLLIVGTNELRLIVSDGWFRGRCGFERRPDGFGSDIGVIARLDLEGRRALATGPAWEVAAGRIVAADLMDGQIEDLRRIGRESWSPVALANDPLTEDRDRLAWSPAPPPRRLESYKPVRITRLDGGRQVVDFGQNLSGWTVLRRLGPEDTSITLTHGEALDAHGDLTLDHLAATDMSGAPLPVGQVDRVTSRGREGDIFEPRHTTHGFRYVAVDGLEEDLTGDDIAARMVRSDLQGRGTFASSDERLNRLHHIAVQSWRGNSCDVPTDCPQRERWGFTGDFQVFSRSAAYLEDIRGFGRKWLTSLADDQYENGRISNVAPVTGERPRGSSPVSPDGSAGWGDAAVIVPWELYRAYGETELLIDFFPMMSAWVDWAAGVAATERSPRRRVAQPDPASHERFIWDSGYHWGEWLEPDAAPFDMGEEKSIVATAYLARSAELTARAAAVLGKADDEQRYRQLAADVAAAWRSEFVRSDGRLHAPSQANYVRGLQFGLFEEKHVDVAVDGLVELVQGDDRHLATGFLSTGMLLPVLADHGRADLAYDVLFRDGEPGWMVMLDRGASTVWESWDGISEEGVPKGSLNHYSKGAVVSFLHEYIAGIRPMEAGYARAEIRPMVTKTLDWAAGTVETVLGTLRSRWTWTSEETVRVEVAVPEGMSARVTLPDGSVHEEVTGDVHWVCSAPHPVRAETRTSVPDSALHPRATSFANPLLGATVGDLLDCPAAVAVLDETIPLVLHGPGMVADRTRSLVNLLGVVQLVLGPAATAEIEKRLAPLF
jgi:alpha-L-rhamnosidase